MTTTHTNNQKILLVNPPGEFKNPVLPLGLALIAAYLKSKNINVQVIDAWAEDMELNTLKNKISQSMADIVGIYMVSPYYDKTKSTIETCRKALPNSIIIAGGPHPSAMPAETLNEIPQLNVCVVGEGEITMYELVKAFQKKSEISEICGIAFRNENNEKIIITKPRVFIKNLDTLPFPAWELFPIERYRALPLFGRKKPFFIMITSRGCPFQCAFCSKDVFRDNYRARSPKNVCDEIEKLIYKYNAKEIQFYDDDFTLNMKRAEEICDEILKRKLKISWSCLTRVDLVNENLLKKMKQAGCWLIAYGVESGNQKILDAINKGYTVEQVVSAFEMTRKVGLKTIAYFMVGLPGETKKTCQETFELSKKIKPNFASWSVLVVYPGSRLFKFIQAGKYQGRLKILSEEENLAGTFFGRGNYTVLEDNLSLKELKELAKKANREFYFRPMYIIQSLKSIRSFSDFKYYLNGGFRVIKSLFG